MLRPLVRPLVTVTAAAVLLAGCSGGGDKKSEPTPGADGTPSAAPSTPTAPELPTFDPPKGFNAVSGLLYMRPETSIGINKAKAGMVGKTALYVNETGLVGRTIDGWNSWQVPSKDVESTKIVDYTAPMAVQLDGKEVIAQAYVQNVEAGGTQKAHGQVTVQWIDPADGKVQSTVTVDLTAAVGPGTTGGSVVRHAYDAATGQVVVSVGVKSSTGDAKYESVSVFADPKTKKGSVILAEEAGGVLNGTVVAVTFDKTAKVLSIVFADGSTGEIKKKIPTPSLKYLAMMGSGGKRAYVSGHAFVKDNNFGHYVNSIYAVDIASGAMVETKMPNSVRDGLGYTCLSDHVVGLVCTYSGTSADHKDTDEILAFDDATGKKSWGYSSQTASRVVPQLTAAYNGYVYGQAETLPAVLDLKTGQDIPAPTPTPGTSGTPTDGGTPTPGSTPSDDGGPTSESTTPTPGAGEPGAWGDTSLLYGEPKAPQAVSKYGSTYLLAAGQGAPLGAENILVVQKAIG